ncbi:DegT/DnrJ/EryC1/StrS family aminotransferase [Syntrophomonas palmitatica]|uniref:DegT/DnrJ/EryC1/StrS family aminotransferase n=1 Tax=Syntrophomonas palmitatica TaxID=402877 RepID=UPI000AE55C56|nr:DegT/DnrJ/EryC1/StrS family aminotransferase [Syntrophomonas palmitatica]
MQELGYNYRITDIQCALGISQLSKLEKFIEARQRIASRYFEAFHHTGLLQLPPQSENRRHAYHLFPILLPLHVNRREFVHYMHEAGIGVQIHYIPVHLQPYYREKYGFKAGDFPLAEEFYKHEVSLPMYYGLTEAEQDYVIQKVRHFIETESLDGE